MFRFAHFLRRPQVYFQISPPLSEESKSQGTRRVKFRRPWLRRAITTGLVYAAGFNIWNSIVFTQVETSEEPNVERSVRRKSKEDKANHRDDLEKGERRFFIPLSWPFLRSGEFYTSKDPEWAEFLKFSNDKQKINSLRKELQQIALKKARQSPELAKSLGGKLNVFQSSIWLKYPIRAPPEYHRFGLHIGDKRMSLVSERMTPENGDRLRHYLQPLPVILGLKDGLAILARKQLSRFKTMGLGIGQEGLVPSPQYLPDDPGKLDSFNDALGREPSSPPNAKSKEDSTEATTGPMRRVAMLARIQQAIAPGFSHGTDLQVAVRAFRWRVRDCMARETPTPRRGSVIFSGPVAIEGSKGHCRVDVRGEYHPATSTWTDVSTQLKDLEQNKVVAIGKIV